MKWQKGKQHEDDKMNDKETKAKHVDNKHFAKLNTLAKVHKHKINKFKACLMVRSSLSSTTGTDQCIEKIIFK